MYSLLCLLFLGFRLRNAAASQVFCYVALLFYLFSREFLHAIGHPLYPYLATVRAVVFFGAFFVWSVTQSLIGRTIPRRVQIAAMSVVGALALFDILVVQRWPGHPGYMSLEVVAIIAPLLAIMLAALSLIRFDAIRSATFPGQSSVPVYWLLAFLFGNLVLLLGAAVEKVLELRGIENSWVMLTLATGVVFSFLLYTARNGAHFFDDKVLRTTALLSDKHQEATAAQPPADALVSRLGKLLRNEKLYLDPDLDLTVVAGRLQEKPETVAQALRATGGGSFKDFVNQHRIQYCLEALRGGSGKKTVLELAFEAGFNSKATFYRYFDKVAGCSPKAYMAQTHQASAPAVSKGL